jgi:hypothetical protein
MRAAAIGLAWPSLIETCKLKTVDPQPYLWEALTAIANGRPMTRIDDLMPKTIQKL